MQAHPTGVIKWLKTSTPRTNITNFTKYGAQFEGAYFEISNKMCDCWSRGGELTLYRPRYKSHRLASPINECRYNEKLVLHELRLAKRESKAGLARITGLTAAAAGGLISSLEEKGLVTKVGKVQGDMGQPATMYSLNDTGAYGLGVSINRGHIETALISFGGRLIASRKRMQVLSTPNATLDLVLEDIDSLIDSTGSDVLDRLAGIGVAIPYNVSAWGQQNIDWSDWDNFNLAAELAKHTGIPAESQNDGNAAAIAELIYGVGMQSSDFVYLFLGSPMVQSVGGGVIVNGNCYSGKTGNAGDLGLIPVPAKEQYYRGDGGRLTHITLSDVCSMNTLLRLLQFDGADIKTRADFDQALKKNKGRVMSWVDDAVSAFISALYSIQAILDMPTFVIDCESDDKELLHLMMDHLNKQLELRPNQSTLMPAIREGSFGSEASAIGAATLPFDSSFYPKN